MTGSRRLMLGDAHIDFGTQNMRPVRKLSRFHPSKQVKIFFNGAFTIGAIVAGLGQRST